MSTADLSNFCNTVERDCHFARIRILDRWTAALFEVAFHGKPISPHQFNLLVAIHAMGDAASAKLLSHYLKMEKSTVSRDLKSLVQKGLLAERKTESDGRAKIIGLTAQGKAAVLACRKAWHSAQAAVGNAFREKGITVEAKPSRANR